MPEQKTFDAEDIIISDDISPEEHNVISEYLRAYRAKQERTSKARSLPSRHVKPKVKAKR